LVCEAHNASDPGVPAITPMIRPALPDLEYDEGEEEEEDEE
jgi:hypothetical protein